MKSCLIFLIVVSLALGESPEIRKLRKQISALRIEQAELRKQVQQNTDALKKLQPKTTTTTPYYRYRHHTDRYTTTQAPVGQVIPRVVKETREITLPENLVGFWPLNKEYGTTDLTINTLNAEFYSDSTPVFVKGIRGEASGAFRFIGKENYYLKIQNKAFPLDDPSSVSVESEESMSGEAGYSSYSSQTYKPLAVKKSFTFAAYVGDIKKEGPLFDYSPCYSYSSSWNTHFWIADGFQFFARIVSDNGVWMDNLNVSTSRHGRRAWNWVVYTFDHNTERLKLFINGTERGNIHVPVNGSALKTDEDIYMGKHCGDNRHLEASVTCAMLFNEALDPIEIDEANDLCIRTRGSNETPRGLMDFDADIMDANLGDSLGNL